MHPRLAIAGFCIALSGCLHARGASNEVARVRAPSGRLDAILVETDNGPGTDFGYLVYVVQAGQRPPRRGEVAWLSVAVRSPRAYGANLRWDTPAALRIEYLDAHAAELRRARVVEGPDTVLVSLRPGVLDSLAAPGGMHYNQRGRP